MGHHTGRGGCLRNLDSRRLKGGNTDIAEYIGLFGLNRNPGVPFSGQAHLRRRFGRGSRSRNGPGLCATRLRNQSAGFQRIGYAR